MAKFRYKPACFFIYCACRQDIEINGMDDKPRNSSFAVTINNTLHASICPFYTLPMATLLSSIIAFSRLNEDNEVIALKSSGVSVFQLMPPVFAFSVISFILALITSIYLIPVSNHSLSSLLFDVAKSSTSIGIKEGVFNNSIPNIVMYADHISSQDHSMEGLFIFDERDPDLPNTIIARKGRIYSDSQQMSIALHLSDGSI